MKVLLIPNFQKEGSNKISLDVINILKEANAEIYALYESKPYIKSESVAFISPENITSNFDFAITIGGDGTIIKASNLILEHEIPIIGVNLGTLGFLAGIETNELYLISEILNGNYSIDERTTIKAEIEHSSGRKTQFTAINDIVISKNAFSGIIDIDIKCNGVETAKYRGDGVIFSTSSGSTAYAMSAGGPIMHPGVKAITVTPICAHSLFARTIVLPESEKITVKTNAELVKRKVFVVADGLNSVDIDNEDVIRISKYDKNIRFIKINGKSFYSSINQKLMER